MEVIDSLDIINAQTAVCTRCDERGYVAINRPIERGQGLKRIWLIGQAPGYSEGINKIAFGGPAGKTLMRWFDQAGLSEEQVRSYFYISAINKCYPGRAKNGGGDRNPTPTERAICRPYLLFSTVHKVKSGERRAILGVGNQSYALGLAVLP